MLLVTIHCALKLLYRHSRKCCRVIDLVIVLLCSPAFPVLIAAVSAAVEKGSQGRDLFRVQLEFKASSPGISFRRMDQSENAMTSLIDSVGWLLLSTAAS